MRSGERPVLGLPRPLLFGLLLLLAVQFWYHRLDQQRFETDYQALGKPLSARAYRHAAMGSEQLLGYLLAIRLQLHDNQAGQHFRYSLIDYDVLLDWLELVSAISPRSGYATLLASRIYSDQRPAPAAADSRIYRTSI